MTGEAALPATSLEQKLLLLWEELLEMDGIGVDDDYFALGGTSLLSVQLFAEISRRFNVQLRLTAILEAPTVRSLARLMTPSGVQQRGNIVCLRGGGSENFFLVHDGLGETLLYANLADSPASSHVRLWHRAQAVAGNSARPRIHGRRWPRSMSGKFRRYSPTGPTCLVACAPAA